MTSRQKQLLEKMIQTEVKMMIKEKKGYPIGTLSDEDNEIYVEARGFVKTEFRNFLNALGPKISKIIKDASNKGPIITNLQSHLDTTIVNVYDNLKIR